MDLTPGDVVPMEDTTGKGHTVRTMGAVAGRVVPIKQVMYAELRLEDHPATQSAK
jgi:hypothetical protein